MLLKIGIWVLAALGLIFVILPFFGYTFFDVQCEVHDECTPVCSTRTILEDRSTSCATDKGPEVGCYQNCESREKRCGFDEEFKNSCVECVKICKDNPETGQACYQQCYNSTATE